MVKTPGEYFTNEEIQQVKYYFTVLYCSVQLKEAY